MKKYVKQESICQCFEAKRCTALLQMSFLKKRIPKLSFLSALARHDIKVTPHNGCCAVLP
jgi:hypothetical protein